MSRHRQSQASSGRSKGRVSGRDQVDWTVDFSQFENTLTKLKTQIDPSYTTGSLIDSTSAVSTLRTGIGELQTLIQDCSKSLNQFCDVALELSEIHDDENLSVADDQVRGLICMHVEFECRKSILEKLREQVNQGRDLDDLVGKYLKNLEQSQNDWERKSVRKKFGSNKFYKRFREQIWEGSGNEGAAPSIKTFLPAEAGDSEGSDEEMEVTEAVSANTFKCPLCLTTLSNSLSSLLCIHSFCQSCFQEYFSQTRSTSSVPCPVTGCPRTLTKTDVEPNEALDRRIKAFQRRQQQQASDNEFDDQGEQDVEEGEGIGSQKPPVASQAATQRRRRIIVDDADD